MTFRLWKWRPDFKSDPDCSCQDCVAYRNGIFEPNYPMPALRGWNYMPTPHDGGVKGDWTRIGAVYVDWSRGKLEVYF